MDWEAWLTRNLCVKTGWTVKPGLQGSYVLRLDGQWSLAHMHESGPNTKQGGEMVVCMRFPWSRVLFQRRSTQPCFDCSTRIGFSGQVYFYSTFTTWVFEMRSIMCASFWVKQNNDYSWLIKLCHNLFSFVRLYIYWLLFKYQTQIFWWTCYRYWQQCYQGCKILKSGARLSGLFLALNIKARKPIYCTNLHTSRCIKVVKKRNFK